jgi:DNA-binding NtrC family response regulator
VEKGKILVIVDDNDLRRVFCDVLNSEGFLVKDVPRTKEALKYLSESYELPIAIFLYVVRSSGEESAFFHAVKSDRLYGQIPVIVHAVDPLDGPYPYLRLKHPFDLDELLNMLESSRTKIPDYAY